MAQNRTESIGLVVEEPGNDWKEIQGLSYALFFETSRLMLLVSIIIIRALTESMGW
jgi:hypothetical protein